MDLLSNSDRNNIFDKNDVAGWQMGDFDYDLPEELIAQTPVEPRDSSRLLVVNRQSGSFAHDPNEEPG